MNARPGEITVCRRGSRGGGGKGALASPPPHFQNPGIDFYSGLRQKFQVYTFIVASEKKNTKGGGGCNSKS